MGKKKDRKRKRESSSSGESMSGKRKHKTKVNLVDLQRRLDYLEEKERHRELKRDGSIYRSSPSGSTRRSRSRTSSRHSSRHRRRRRHGSTRADRSLSVVQRERERTTSIESDNRSARRHADLRAERPRSGSRIESVERNEILSQACSSEKDFNLGKGNDFPIGDKEDLEDSLSIHNEIEIPEEFIDILGTNPDKPTNVGFKLYGELIPRWRNILQNGIPKDESVALLQKYEIPLNLQDLLPPKLNPEIIAIIRKNNLVKTRDFSQSEVQNQLGKGISVLGKALTTLLNDSEHDLKNLKKDLFKDLCDAGKIFTNLFHRISTSRKNGILPLLNDSIKDAADKSNPTEFLFGNDLTEKVKTIKNLESICKDLKNPASTTYQPKPQKREGGSTYKGPGAKREFLKKDFRRPVRRWGEAGPQMPRRIGMLEGTTLKHTIARRGREERIRRE
ncbi:uncharacterized protein LOC126736134 [Anthonomus grandis grandis]|uniref:uncharacterized protein LOC126736134 n=1 Tax=Anthonomus grandis grandis TaxID=2921223 RepID=UPI0021656489|nr:uncharacterized protein LOC126736134 [Anthonomus grandis grandis]